MSSRKLRMRRSFSDPKLNRDFIHHPDTTEDRQIIKGSCKLLVSNTTEKLFLVNEPKRSRSNIQMDRRVSII